MDIERFSHVGKVHVFVFAVFRVNFDKKGRARRGYLDSILPDFDSFGELVYTQVFPVQVQFDKFTLGGVIGAEPGRKLVGEAIFHQGLVGVVCDESPIPVGGHSQHGLFVDEFNFIAFLGHVRGGIASSLDGQVQHFTFGGFLAPYLQLGGDFGFAVFDGGSIFGFDNDSRDSCVRVFRIV